MKAKVIKEKSMYFMVDFFVKIIKIHENESDCNLLN